MPNMGLKFTTPRSKVACSTSCAAGVLLHSVSFVCFIKEGAVHLLTYLDVQRGVLEEPKRL